MSKTITVTLSAANMGPQSTEGDFDAWAQYVADDIGEVASISGGQSIEVEQFAFTGRGSESEDRVEGATEEQEAAILSWLSHDGFDAWCASMDVAL